jgi:hypothetical protein
MKIFEIGPRTARGTKGVGAEGARRVGPAPHRYNLGRLHASARLQPGLNL